MVSKWIAIALLALAAGEALLIRHLYAHRVVHIDIMSPTQGQAITFYDPSKPDSYVMHSFPKGRGSCDGYNTICYIRI